MSTFRISNTIFTPDGYSRKPRSCIDGTQQSKYRLFDTNMDGTRNVMRNQRVARNQMTDSGGNVKGQWRNRKPNRKDMNDNRHGDEAGAGGQFINQNDRTLYVR
jgi:hypothetical protein